MQDFTEKEAGREYARQCDLEKQYPRELWEVGVKQGFLGLTIPPEYGGMGADAIMFAIFVECLSKYSYEMAALQGDHFVLNGQKQFSTGAHLENNIIMMAVRTDKEAVPKHRGISVLLVPNNLPGVECKRLPLIARRAVGTCSVFLTDAKVPKENLLGELNRGWRVIIGHLELERVVVTASVCGEAQDCLDDAIRHAQQRLG
jgi:alkylation response protein AidB-like acyl-CoA dehydrogenase